ncbi:hypothetical protein CJ030_MR2G013624 [Morella rubra]|uniref:Uncharacterized protein n=1 Tax=Morella rubra TaxID=262757 RepID=A0A6A1WET5_9ROSI|nr:hypothetical protein CJ030_MR2G013624 [Morella rubra]
MWGRKANVSSLSDFEIVRLFVEQDWENLLDMGNEVYPKYVRIFFCNLTIECEDHGLFTIISMVGGQKIVLNEVMLRDILGIPHVGPRAYDIKLWPVCKGFDYGDENVPEAEDEDEKMPDDNDEHEDVAEAEAEAGDELKGEKVDVEAMGLT